MSKVIRTNMEFPSGAVLPVKFVEIDKKAKGKAYLIGKALINKSVRIAMWHTPAAVMPFVAQRRIGPNTYTHAFGMTATEAFVNATRHM